ncbi:hypothetical protein EVAR_24262_1 [Eumeta japonica]|uniref:Uncharacterized protein n=1 Tax=Eumeta variegata TaxID=151549 RepID=A0A4C1VEZ3_EUMVA|nr:hypothetical protein EVAR_24262_1 [Eumeta japonica]
MQAVDWTPRLERSLITSSHDLLQLLDERWLRLTHNPHVLQAIIRRVMEARVYMQTSARDDDVINRMPLLSRS